MKTKILILAIVFFVLMLNVSADFTCDYVDIGTETLPQYNRYPYPQDVGVAMKSDNEVCILVTNSSYSFLDLLCYNLEDKTIHSARVYEGSVMSAELSFDSLGYAHICFVKSDGYIEYALVNPYYIVSVDQNFSVYAGPYPQDYTCAIDVDVNRKPHIIYVKLEGSNLNIRERFKNLNNEWIDANVLSSGYRNGHTIKIIGNTKYIFAVYFDQNLQLKASTDLYSTTYTYSWKSLSGSAVGAHISADFSYNNHRLYISTGGNSYDAVFMQDASASINVSKYNRIYNISHGEGYQYQYIFCSIIHTDDVYCARNEHLTSQNFHIYRGTSQYTTFSNLYPSKLPVLRKNSKDDKILVYTTAYLGDKYIRVCKEGTTFNVNGYVYNAITTAPIFLAEVCFKSPSRERCGITDPEGNFTITDLTEGTYNITISADSFGQRYQTQVHNNVYVDESFSPVYYYLYPVSATNITQNLVTATFVFLDETYPNKPIQDLSVQFEYIDCLTGCPSCCSLRGNKYYGRTDANGRIIKVLPEGEYEISFPANSNLTPYGKRYLFYVRADNKYYDKVQITIEENPYNQVFYIKQSDITFYFYGGTIDAETLEAIANVSIYVYNDKYFFSTTSNESGLFILPIHAQGQYTAFAEKAGYLHSVMLLTFDIKNRIVEYIFLLTKNRTYTYSLSGYTYDTEGNIVPQVNLKLFSLTNVKIYETNSDNSGFYKIENIKSGVYTIIAIKDNFDRTTDHVIITNKNVTHNIYLKNLSKIVYAFVNGSIFDASSLAPIPYAKVTLEPKNLFFYEADFFDKKEVISTVDGYFEIQNIRADKCYNLQVKKEGYEIYSKYFCMEDKNVSLSIPLEKGIPEILTSIQLRDCETYAPLLTTIYVYSDASLTNLFMKVASNATGRTDIYLPEGVYYLAFDTPLGYSPIPSKEIIVEGVRTYSYCSYKSERFYKLIIYFYEEDTTTIISDVEVTVKPINYNQSFVQKSNSRDGSVYFELPAGNYYITAVKKGYLPSRIKSFGKDYYELNSDAMLSEILIKQTITQEETEKKLEKTELDVLDFIAINLPNLFVLFLLLFLISAINKAVSP